MQEANSVGLSSGLAQKVQDGTIDINEYDSDTREKIKEYQEWLEKASLIPGLEIAINSGLAFSGVTK